MDEQRTAFLNALDAERAARGLSWRAVARAAGVDQSAIWRLRNGKPVMDTAIWKLWAWLDSLEQVDHDTLLMQALSSFVEVE
jgi:transcriptional regulator with XRE-family HTH domain